MPYFNIRFDKSFERIPPSWIKTEDSQSDQMTKLSHMTLWIMRIVVHTMISVQTML